LQAWYIEVLLIGPFMLHDEISLVVEAVEGTVNTLVGRAWWRSAAMEPVQGLR